MANEQKEHKNLTSEEQLQEWRRGVFIEMGFLPHQATKLSQAKDPATGFLVDRHKVAKALEKGCSKELAFKIYT